MALMLSERTRLVLQLIDDDLDKTLDHVERRRLELRVWSLAHKEWRAAPGEDAGAFRERMRNMWIGVVNTPALHYWAPLMLRLHARPARVVGDECLALAMGFHTRLGKSSALRMLSPDVVGLIGNLLHQQVEAELQAEHEAIYALWKYYVYVNKNPPENVLMHFQMHCENPAQFLRASKAFISKRAIYAAPEQTLDDLLA